MSRSGYSDDCDESDNWGRIRWRGAVTSAIRGKRGQAFLRELRDALDTMPIKRLAYGTLQCESGVCALGAVAAARRLDVSGVIKVEEEVSDDDEWNSSAADAAAALLNISPALAREITYLNDDAWHPDAKPEEIDAIRFRRVRKWVERQIVGPSPSIQSEPGK